MTPDFADEAGPLFLRVDFPGGPGRLLACLLFPVLAVPFLVLFVQLLRSPAGSPSRAGGLAVHAGFLAMIGAGFFLALRSLSRRPKALEVREKSLVLVFGGRREAIDWKTVRGVEQDICGTTPTYVVEFYGRRTLVIGTGDRALELAQEIVRRAGLRWVHEPFSARRPV